MFGPASSSTTPTGWHQAVRRALDVAIAFATLDGYGIDGPRDAAPEPASPQGPKPQEHPHRAPLTAPRPPRRPGAVRQRPVRCVTPLELAPRRRSARQQPVRG
jgi:hypothetical protein